MSRRLLHRRLLAAASTFTALVLAVSACSSSGSKGGSSSSTDASTPPGSTGGGGTSSTNTPATGSKFKLGLIADVGGAVDDPNIVSAVKGAITAINNSGGFDGHPAELDFCNEAGDPNKAAACARQMVSDKVAAMVGTFTYTNEASVNTILANAGIPNIGPFAFGPYDTAAAKTTFNIFPGNSMIYVGMAQCASTIGKKVAFDRLEGPLVASLPDLISTVLKTNGAELVKTVQSPQTATDLSPQAAALVAASPDVVVFATSGPAQLATMQDMIKLGYTGRFISSLDALHLDQIQGLGDTANQMSFASPFALNDSSTPGAAEFQAAMEAQKATGDKNAPTFAGYVPASVTTAYLAVKAVAAVANEFKTVTAAGLLDGFNKAKDIDLGGYIPAWTPSNSVGLKAFPRVSQANISCVDWTGGASGKLTLKSGPTDVTAAAKAALGG